MNIHNYHKYVWKLLTSSWTYNTKGGKNAEDHCVMMPKILKEEKYMLERMEKAVSLAIAFFMVMIMVAVPITMAAQGDSTMLRSKEVNTDELKVGNLVAEGIRGANGTCDFSGIKVRTTAPGDGKTQWVGIKFDSQCRAK